LKTENKKYLMGERRGFTLLEVMIAMLILGMAMASLWSMSLGIEKKTERKIQASKYQEALRNLLPQAIEGTLEDSGNINEMSWRLEGTPRQGIVQVGRLILTVPEQTEIVLEFYRLGKGAGP